MKNNYLTVTALNRYIAFKFETDQALRNVLIQGEISNFRISKGHLYFSLKDENSEIRAIMFSSAAASLNFIPVDGMMVLIRAQVGVYQKGGTYSLTVSYMKQAGLGESYLNFLRLKEKLQKEGLFDQDKKLPIPEYTERIGVITSDTGDAINDITSTIFKRWPLTMIYLYPVLVQGTEAPKSIIKAINQANQDGFAEVLIIARGGGSVEDLSCFNDENLARTIFASKIPTVSGVGHEADFTICDFVASLRAPTPTGAAVLLTKNQYEIAQIINEKTALLAIHLKKVLEQKFYRYQEIITNYHFRNFREILDQKDASLSALIAKLESVSPLGKINAHLETVKNFDSRLQAYNLPEKIATKLQLIDERTASLHYYINQIIRNQEQKHQQFLEKIIILNPLNLMKKGYTLTYQDGVLLTRAANVKTDRNLTVKFHDGEIIAKPVDRNRKKEE